MKTEEIAHPPIASEDQWLEKRLKLLEQEKALTKEYDRISAERRRLPMVKVEKQYEFKGPEGPKTLKDLFDGCRQLVVYHFMFDPGWDKGCGGCTSFVDALGDMSLLQERDTNFVLISRAPLEKLEAYKQERHWDWPWYSSFGSDFNYDYQASSDPNIRPMEYNYRPTDSTREGHGVSIFFRLGDDVFHTYSSYARGVEDITDSYRMLDLTPYGRQEDFEDSPEGWPQKPTYG